jgi:hypothetical protein
MGLFFHSRQALRWVNSTGADATGTFVSLSDASPRVRTAFASVLFGVGARHNRGSASAQTPWLAPPQRRTSPRTKVNCSSTMNFIPVIA